jgi:hypothetical protein
MRGPTGWLHRGGLQLSAVVLGLALAGCSSEPDQPATLPDDRPSATSTSATPSAMTPEEEVEAAVRAYYAELTRAAQTQNTSTLKSMMTRGCPCYGYARSIDQARRRGQKAPEAAWTIRAVRVHHVNSGTAAAEVRYVVEPYALIDGQGDEIRQFPRRKGHVDLSLVDAGEGWIIGNVFNLEA